MTEKHYYQGAGHTALLHVEMIAEDQMSIKLHGDPVIVAKMIATAMEAKAEICAAMIAAVFSWADEKGITKVQLQYMVKNYPK